MTTAQGKKVLEGYSFVCDTQFQLVLSVMATFDHLRIAHNFS